MKSKLIGLLFLWCTILKVDCLKLNKVFILSRHNLRTPLTDKLQHVTPFLMPKWDTKSGFLTSKGFSLEEYMGEYFSDWLRKERLFTDLCPSDDSVFLYSNVKQRTIETAKAFAKSAFKNCNVTVYNKKSAVDPVFNPIITNTSEVFKELYTASMQKKLNNLNLEDAYIELDKIIDIKNSEICKKESFCDLIDNKDVILFSLGEEPNVFGPLSIGNSLVDAFLMSYYSGARTEDIAWGKINSEEQWRKLLEITWENQNVRFNHTLANDIARQMLNVLKSAFLEDNLARKFTMLVGHDSNLNAIMAALRFKSYVLPGQYEKTPIGGKIVFQKWREDTNEYLKVEYVYQTMEQLRNGSKLSKENPPQSVVLELRDCKINESGFCLWTDFVSILKNIN
ncbi:unnamed protein product [Diatraea saccharalis]|uniref:Glucose-1-phosphatase n=1 Tax=Diatraea saccharalis TaxID=40085 RepID=A0A9N9REC7_9NEOP|nr:unnamed protein product [Diatraea saccharalis]